MAAEKILVLDNESAGREATMAALRAQGNEVVGAPIDRSTFEVLRQGAFDLIVVNGRKMGNPATQVLQVLRRASPRSDILFVCDNRKVLEAVNALGGVATSIFSLGHLAAAVEGVRKTRQSIFQDAVASVLATPLEVNRRLVSGEPIESFAQTILRSLATDLGADYVSLRLLDASDPHHGRRIQDTVNQAILPSERAMVVEAIENRVTGAESVVLYLDGTSRDLSLDRELVRAGVSAAFGLPLVSENKVFGVLTAIAFAPREPFSHSGVNMSMLIAGSLALGIKNGYANRFALEGVIKEAEARLAESNEEVERLSGVVETLSAARREAQRQVLQSLRALTATIDAREVTRQGHSQAVEQIAVALAERLQLAGTDVVSAAILHDVGMLAVPEAVLSAKRQLSKKDWAVVTNHPLTGEELAKNIGLGEEVLKAVRHHHENYDGTGYPDRLAGKDIPELARLLRVADAYVTMRSARPWRKALDRRDAIRELQQAAGRLYDPTFAAVLIELVNSEGDGIDRADGTELISTLSHELRSPLTSLIGFSEMLALEPDLTSSAREAATEIKEEALYLSRLVDTLLDISREGSGPIRLERQPVDLAGLIRSRLRHYESRPGTHRFESALSDDLPVVLADPDRVVQVLTNLIDNAVKYSPDGGLVRVTATHDGAMIEVSVEDEGIGIPEGEVDKIFETFYRGEGEAVKNIRGTGLGLAICKRVIEGHGGTIWAENRPEGGSVLRFTLPLNAP